MDNRFRVEVIAETPNPNQLIYRALHQDYSEEFAMDEPLPSEEACGAIAVKRLLSGNRGHYGPLEGPQISFNIGWFPHSTMQQIRTHRVGISVDCQSMRYTGQRIVEVTEGRRDIEDVFYLRPLGSYGDRQGKKYDYTDELRQEDLDWCLQSCHRYAERIRQGFAEEHARGLIPFDIRQHWVLSCNMRSLMHLLAVRGKRNAQVEAQQLCHLMLPHFKKWSPQIYAWFMDNQWLKGRLAP